jgi:predicted DNA-binding transcriptional regulator AlpA
MSPPIVDRLPPHLPADSQAAEATLGAAGTLLTEAETAQLLGISPRTLRNWRRGNRGPVHVRLGGMVRYTPADVESFIAASRRGAASTSDKAPDTDPLQSAASAEPVAEERTPDEPGLDLIMRAMLRAQKDGGL